MPEYQILVPPPRRRRSPWLVVAVAVVVAAVGIGAFAIGRHSPRPGSTSSNHAGRSGASGSSAFVVASTVPKTGATNVASDQVVSVHLSLPVAGPSGMPTFDPPVSGTWKKVGPDTLSFVATAPFIPTSTETLRIPDGVSGAPQHHRCSSRTGHGHLHDRPGQHGATSAATGAIEFPSAFLHPHEAPDLPRRVLTAQAGTFAWRWPDQPPSLVSLWIEGYENVITKGALMNFESQNGLVVDGLAGPRVWSTLLADIGSAKVDADSYTYAYVSKQLPEAMTMFENGAPVLVNIPVNTGAPGADTTDGTYPVFEHVTSSRMQGTNPDGSKYDDPNVPWASYFDGGDALHGFVRATYGSPQSNGCVEMRISDAAKVWPLSPIGTLVTVVGPAS